MISKKEVLAYLNEMKKTEKMMDKTYIDLAKKIKSEKYKKEFEKMSQEEKEHFSLITSLEKLIENL